MLFFLGLGAALAAGATAAPTPPVPTAYRALYRTLVEIDTSHATGSCTAAATAMATALAAAGFPAADLHAYATADHPKDGGLVAVLPGSDPKAKALLLVAHLDVVDAHRAEWQHDPYTLVEEGGYFHGRGVSDDKAMAAALVDGLIRMRQERFHPRRAVKIALTCGEETATAFNGAHYLATERRALIDAGLALVPSGGATLDGQGRPVSLTIQAGEKVQQGFRIEARGIGSHASRPTPANAIYILAAALLRLERLQFPVTFNPATRLYFTQIAAGAVPADAAAIRTLLADPADAAAQARVTADPAWNGMLRTTCVATIVETGQQANTIAPTAAATVNCRLLPGVTVASVQAALATAVGGPAIGLSLLPPLSPTPPSPPLTRQLLGPVETVAAAMWPGVAIAPTMLTGATDARYLNAAGIPAYGLTTVFSDPDGGGVHAPNERVRVRAVYEGRDFLYRLTKIYAAAPALAF